MRILLIAYEFPPSPSPQSLRWAYLVRELAALGHEIHVLTIDLGPDDPGLPALPASVRVHRTWAGPIRGMMARRRWQRVRRANPTQAPAARDARQPASEHGLPTGQLRPGWKVRMWDALQVIARAIVFPDLRGEWLRPARARMQRLLRESPPDIVISSHEPATTLELGLLASRQGFPWVADLGDPVLAPYTPAHWRRRSLQLESDVCRHADRVLVTSAQAAELLRQRHGAARVELLTQGFPETAAEASPPHRDEPGADPTLELLYTGSFYAFRSADALLAAVLGCEGVRLSVASVTIPAVLQAAAARHPDRIRLLGFLPHATTLALQRRADVLVSIANADSSQVPGKLYEYAGALRPILHLASGDDDPSAAWIRQHERGWVTGGEADAIGAELARLRDLKQNARLEAGLDLGPERVRAHGWPALARRLDALLHAAAADAGETSPPAATGN